MLEHRDSGQLADEQAASDEHSKSSRFLAQVEISHALTTLYTLVEIGRSQDDVANESTVQAVSGKAIVTVFMKSLTVFRSHRLADLPYQGYCKAPVGRIAHSSPTKGV